jgi:hypothetical protein
MSHQGQLSQQSSPNSSSEKGSNAIWGVWTPALVEKLVGLFNAKKTAQEISDEFGAPFTRNSIIGKQNRLGLRRNDPGNERKPKLRVVRANTNSNAMRVLRSVERGPRKILTAQTPPTIWIDEPQTKCCNYPYGDGPFVFCGLPTLDGYSYCSGHKTLCWVPPRERWA